jgi:transposase InsO family protein
MKQRQQGINQFEYIEVFYNRKRRHPAHGYHSPAKYEARTVVA